jgi:uncharacterized membrane protein YjdF
LKDSREKDFWYWELLIGQRRPETEQIEANTCRNEQQRLRKFMFSDGRCIKELKCRISLVEVEFQMLEHLCNRHLGKSENKIDMLNQYFIKVVSSDNE